VGGVSQRNLAAAGVIDSRKVGGQRKAWVKGVGNGGGNCKGGKGG